MTYSSCIRIPDISRFITLYDWQKQFCEGNLCAAFLLSHFICWHDWKIKHDDYYRRVNDIAEAHGDQRSNIEDAYLFFTMEDFLKALMGLFAKKSISEGLDLLVKLRVISVHKNPNPRYHFDKTKYFKLYPDVCNEFLKNYRPETKKNKNLTQVIDNFDSAKMDNAFSKSGRPSSKNSQPSRKNGQAITDTTNNTTNRNKTYKKNRDEFHYSRNEIEANHHLNSATNIVSPLCGNENLKLDNFKNAMEWAGDIIGELS